MIVFVNGAFGAGKTTVAEKLNKILPNSILYDPEEIGFMLHAILEPIEWSGDFQDYPMWRSLVPVVAKGILEEYRPTLIVPMTIWRKDYFKEVTDGLKAIDRNFYHFCLIAPLEVIHSRIKARGEQEYGHWIYEQSGKCVNAFRSNIFDERIDTSVLNSDEIASRIAGRIQSSLY